ncbi:DNA-binding transcriptional regulator, LysR family [Andreprevotia lacus DSM 23236]|jgi:DNA-binding transcriptional LysR family regulator|uniref:DNA-binding transcriptional regulator, LysR family n=1 Tax=Andreprevotia lacus DSM 23236 TaxID=1121001 RepID=A0A1W1X574_9NEIS|nr:LysR family transcriptional regulator [Andreprevotia lacus]SMC19099.1 DNA-binding transcriptional regulator, LysR family [Andreprevotia lacus DSM 23236]
MDIKLWRAFVAVAEHGHYGQAAEALFITQPALSKQIQALELELGGQLFERGRHGALLTAFGAGVLDDARALVRHAAQVRSHAREVLAGQRGRLRIGFGLSTLDLAPQAIAAYRQQYPQVDITLNDLSSAEQQRRLLAGELDLGFVRLPVDGALDCLPLRSETLALVLPAHVRWQTLPVALDELNETGFVALTPSRGPGLAGQIARWCASRAFVPRVLQHSDDIQTVLALVAAGVGLALLPARATALLAQGIRSLPLPDAAAQWQLGLAWQAARANPARDGFVAMLRAGGTA